MIPIIVVISVLVILNQNVILINSSSDFKQHSTSTTCRHYTPKYYDIPPPVVLNNNRSSRHHHLNKRDLGPAGPLRIRVFYHKSVDALKKRDRDRIRKLVVPNAIKEWERALNVKRSQTPIFLNRKCRNSQYFSFDEDPGEQYCNQACDVTKCGEFAVPESHLKPCKTCNSVGLRCQENPLTRNASGVDHADFVLYVSAVQTQQCGETIGESETVAYAAHCQQEADLDRPIAGHTNICPSALNSTDNPSLTSTVRHELLHALGFSASLYAFYRDKKGNPRTARDDRGNPPLDLQLRVRKWSDSTIKMVTRPWKVRGGYLNRTIHIMVTPRVVQEVRTHFGCPNLEGAELEDQGGDGTALTHWEKRIFQDEAMTGTVHTKDPAYSRLTFALLEDTGWYQPNYEYAHEISWGRGMGCEFAQKSCMEMMERNDRHFCQDLMSAGSSKTTCTFDSTSIGSCNLVQFEQELPPLYQNFGDKIQVPGIDAKKLGTIGGSVMLADFCPYIQEFTWRSNGATKSRGTRCTEIENQPAEENNYAMEEYGEGSMCFEQSGPWEQKGCRQLRLWQKYGGGCYSSICEDGMLKIIIRNVTFECQYAGQIIEVALLKDEWLHEGTVICPDCNMFCDNCENSAEDTSTTDTPDIDELKENLDQVCSKDPGVNFFMEFAQALGLENSDLFS